MIVASPAQADSTLCSGNSYSTCTNAGYTDHGYGANNGTSYWTMYQGHNCTNYAAYMASQNGAPTPNYNLGSALTWASQAASHGVPVNATPAVGAIAQWDAWAGYAGSSGHVAYVEAVTSNSITISEDNFASGPFSWKTITMGSADWPSNFIHFADVSDEATHRIALLNSSSQIYVKDTLSGGGWISQGASASAIDVGGSRVALINSAGQVFAKDNVASAGGWISQGATAKKVVVGSGGRMFIINSADQLYGKDNVNITGGWAYQGAEAIDVAVGTNRVAIVTPCGAVYAKSNLSNGGWIKQAECNTAQDVELSSTGLIAIIRMDGAVFAKDNINGLGGWIDQGADATQLKLGANRLLILTPGSYVYAKDSLGTGGWISQGTTAVGIAISDQGRFVVRNIANQVYAKDAISPGGWVNQEAVALTIAA